MAAVRKHYLLILAVVVVAAFLLRLEVCRELLANDPSVSRPPPATDMATYMKLAAEVAAGEYGSKPFYYQPFYYAVFLPSIYLVFGKGTIWPVLLSQCLLGAATVWLAAISAGMLAGKRASVITAVLAAFSTILVFYTPYFLLETLQSFWLALILYLSLVSIRRGKLWLWLLTGLAVGCSILTRGNIWLMVPGIALFALLSGKMKKSSGSPTETRRKMVWTSLSAKFAGWGTCAVSCSMLIIFLSGVILPQIPFFMHNTKVCGKFTGPSTAGSAVLALGNTPEAPPGGRNPNLGPGPMEYPETYKYWMDTQSEMPVSRRIRQWFLSEPGAFLELQFRKLLLFWDASEIPNNVSLLHNGKRSTALNSAALIPTSVILAACIGAIFLFLAGLLRGRLHLGKLLSTRKLQSSALLWMIFSFWAATAAFYILARFRVPGVPLCAVAAGIFIHGFISEMNARSRRRFRILVLPALLFSVIVVFFGYDIYRFRFEAGVMRIVRPAGTHVRLSDRTLVVDNGPFTFGGWGEIAVEPGKTIVKEFAQVKEPRDGTVEFIMPVLDDTPKDTVFSINGVSAEVSFSQCNPPEISKTVPFNGGKFEIRLEKSASPVFLLMDFQRNYGRTSLDGKKGLGELVCRIHVRPE